MAKIVNSEYQLRNHKKIYIHAFNFSLQFRSAPLYPYNRSQILQCVTIGIVNKLTLRKKLQRFVSRHVF